MTDIYIVDYLGDHCGMHYYLEAFRQVLLGLPDCRIHILSNFSNEDEAPFFLNQYKGGIINKGVALLRNINRLRRFVKKHPAGLFIYLTYGNSIDLPFMNIISSTPRHIIDIHEAIAQNVDSNEGLKARFKKMYARRIKNVISHSTRTDKFLNEYGFEGKVFRVPHFKYVFPKDYAPESIPAELTNAIDKERINLLFFGNLNESKGVDILIRAVNMLPQAEADRLNVVIAGKNFDGSVYKVAPHADRRVNIFARHISDDELRFLYQNVDFLALPYRKTSQSGILEMAFYFRRPIIASDAEYFRLTLKEFPSFGRIAEGLTSAKTSYDEARSYAEALSAAIKQENPTQGYFSSNDYDRYEHRAQITRFVNELKDYLK